MRFCFLFCSICLDAEFIFIRRFIGESVLFFNILYSFETSLSVNILSLSWLDAQFLAEKLPRCGVSHCLEEKLQKLLSSSEGSGQINFTVLTGRKTVWISVGFKLKPVPGMLSLLGVSTIRSQSEDFPAPVLLILVNGASEAHIAPLCILWPDGISPTLDVVKILKMWGVS